jgi:hypothetical protein
MNHLGIDFVSRVAKAADGRLFTYFRGHALGLFEFIAGVHTEDYPLDQLFRLLARIYGLRLDLPMERETFGLETLDHYQALLRPGERRFDDLRRLLAAHQASSRSWRRGCVSFRRSAEMPRPSAGATRTASASPAATWAAT